MSHNLSEQVAGEIRAGMARKQMTQDVLLAELRARGVKMSPNTLSRRLRAEGAFRLDQLATVADVLGVSVETLMTGAAA